jgi:primosomal protein N' (replication factor Y)
VTLVLVAVPIPTLDLLTYHVAADMVTPVVGARVVVPLGKRLVTGVAVDVDPPARGTDRGGVTKPIHKVIDREAFLPADVITLARWVAEYYAAGAGEAITAILPPHARDDRAHGYRIRRVVAITPAGVEMLRADAATASRPLTAKQRGALQMLAAAPTGVPASTLATHGTASDSIARMKKRGLVALAEERVERDPFETLPAAPPTADGVRALTAEQTAALERLTAMAATRTFGVALLHGVTGSGKTEVYIRLAAATRAAGRGVLMLVPEIALTPAIAAVFRDAFGERVAIQHSGLSAGERYDQWQRIRRGAIDVVVGTRSAVFAPIADLGLIIVDEEHDGSYKQEESPRYHARDVAIVRAQQARALAVLGSATPSMESYFNAIRGKYARVALERRVLDRPLPVATIVDMREEYAQKGPDVVLSAPLTAAIADRLDRNEQSLILLNRRGFATAVFCRQCAATIDCPNCSVSLVVHGEGRHRRARCHYCDHVARIPTACPFCAGLYLEQEGFGTERVEAEILRAFPTARVARLDRDTARRRGAIAPLLSRFRRGEIDVLVGTQMIAKGHDFPRVTLVGIVSADVGLGTADFRAGERTFQLLTQVVGRAGRGDQPGDAVIQTLYPTHYSIQLGCAQDYAAFYDQEIRFRRAMRYPPLVALINTIVRSRTPAGAISDAALVAGRLRHAVRGADPTPFQVLGPAPAPLGRLRGEYRAQLLLKGTDRRAMRHALADALAARPDIERRTIVDIDPLSVL